MKATDVLTQATDDGTEWSEMGDVDFDTVSGFCANNSE